ncbi:MAG: tetratricopeptide repeat protein [Hallella sp.]|uniref:type IX secretion system periplasmic lipoprotein PorW/SprE n=1 Tax=Hallella sp. TaxID=2980186 RepID=UPI002E7A47EC|nr:tetratricopeptide repeat protein [Hallella sp.]MED9946158.1 tetratricopeptide repeat protein [Hallella sp.]
MKRYIHLLLAITGVMVITACSTEKNTAKSRWWQAFNTRYNTYYNGTLAYIDGSLAKETGNKDNFTEIIPLYTVSNKASRELGKGEFDKAIEKAEKAIKLHSIKRKPEWTKNRRKTEKDLEWLNRKEYNPFLWKAWMLMGRSQFFQGDFDGAASTFNYMSRLYATQPAIYGRARAWLAKCYIENDFLYDAEDIIRNMQRDSLHWRARKEWDYTYADYYIHTADYAKAIPYLRNVIKHEMRKKQRAREWYLMGQLQAALGNKAEAYKAFRKVVRLNPPYELEFNAQIAQTEVLAAHQSKQMVRRLKRMAASDNNKDYLDQVYYAIGNIYLAQKDTASAIANYEKGAEKATRNGIEKGVLLLKLGDLYWTKKKFSDAQRCYGQAIGLLDKERDDYKQLSNRSKVLDELVPFTEAVHLQDSLQQLAQMPAKERNEAIDRVIEALKKKEKEEKNKAAEANAQQAQQRNNAIGNRNQNTTYTNNTANQQANGQWYFYNPMAVQQGKQLFQRQWGKRENVDNWQRVNTTVVAGLGVDSLANLTDAQRDSLDRVEAAQDSLEQVMDSAQNDPHKREYYMAQIPFSEEQVAASNAIIMDGLFHSGVIFKDKLDELALSEKALTRLTSQYTTYEHMDEAYYHLFLLYSRMGQPATAEGFVEKLKAGYPESQWTLLLTDPFFTQNAREGVHLEDSLYAATYEAFKADRYAEVDANTHLSESRFPLGANRDKFIFIDGLSKLNNGDGTGCLNAMRTVVEKYPKSSVSEMAGMIINGVKEGKQLRGGKFDIGDVWSRRSVVLSDSDSIHARQFTNERNTNFVFMFVYQPDSVDQNKLLFELARYNFTNYLVRDFEIATDEGDGIQHMRVSGFRNYDEALQYARQVLRQAPILRLLGKSRPVIISEENLPLLGTNFSYDEYDAYYNKHFAPLKIATSRLLTEPAEITTNAPKKALETEKEVDDYLEGTFISPDEKVDTPTQTVVPVDEPSNEPAQTGTTIPVNDNDEGTNRQETIIPIGNDAPAGKGQNETIVPAQEEEKPAGAKDAKVQTTTVTTNGQDPVAKEPKAAAKRKETTKQAAATQKAQGKPAQAATKPAQSKPAQTATKPATPTVKEEQKAQPTISNGAYIFFDDDTQVPPSKSPAKKKTADDASNKKKDTNKQEKDRTNKQDDDSQKTNDNKDPKDNTFDLEDEYYDLDGF